MNKTLKRFLIAAVLFTGLLAALVLAERGAPDSGIRTLPAALWYALTTLTTVGYGDLYPLTPLGRVFGAVLQLGSLGLLALLISALLTVFRSRLRPMWRLFFARRMDWFIFTSAEEASQVMADALLAEKPDRVVIFSLPEVNSSLPGISTSLTPSELLRLRRSEEGVHLFFLSDSFQQNEAGAAALADTGCRIYCLSPHRPEQLPDRQLRFDPWEICARLYWHRFPLVNPDEEIWIVGDGRYARALIEQALAVNVLSPAQSIRYVLCGDDSDFHRCHPALEPMTESAGADGTKDRLVFHSLPWNEDAGALCAADRIIFCSDREEENLERVLTLQKYYPVTAQVHARLSLPLEGAACFGSVRELYTPDLVMRARLDRLARQVHENYRAVNGGPRWEELSDFARRSNLAAADHWETKLRLLLPGETVLSPTATLCRRAAAVYAAADEPSRQRFREIEHIRWMRFHLLQNWRWGPERSNERRIHPMLLPFERLTNEEQAKDDYAWNLLGAEGIQVEEGL